MRINFQQGIITYPDSLGQQVFLVKIGPYVSLQTANSRTDISFAHGSENYLFTEASDVNNAWGPLAPSTDYWLYWDISLLTAIRTFGFTTLAPIVSSIEPIGVDDQHWFNLANKKMYVYQGSNWREVVRVFAAKINDSLFTGLGMGIVGKPFAGSQVGLNIANVITGRIIVDNVGTPIRRVNGLFFTTEDDFFVNGSPVNVIRLEANVVNATANQNVAKYQVVKYVSFGHVMLATYNDVQTTVIAMCMEDLFSNDVGTLCVQGIITNPDWNWQTVGAELWVDGYGLLTEIDPHITTPIAHPNGKVPVARVLTQTSIFFDQGLGGKGDKGENGSASTFASDIVFGVTKLSLAAANPTNPIVVGDNDPRLIPYTHPATHPATIITTDTYGFLNGLNTQVQLHQLVDRPLGSLSNVLVPTPSTNDYLKWNGTNWINSPGSNQSITLSGDVTGIGTTSIATTLATVNSNIGTFGSSVDIPTFTVNGKGLITAASSVAISIPPAGVTSVGVSGGTTGLTTTGGPITNSGTITLTGTLAPTNGGTGLNTIGNSLQVLRTNVGATALEWATISAGSGTVTSIGVSGGTTGLTTTGGPITTSGTITFDGVLAISHGGTGQTTANDAFNALIPSQSTNSGKFLTTDGTTTSWATVAGGGGGATIVDETISAATFYPTFVSAISGSMTTANVASTKLTYNPLSGTIYSTNFHSTSDENLKTDIAQITNGLSIINQLVGVGFSWKDTGIKSFGVIAQQLEKVIPEIVQTSSEGKKSVEYDAIIAFLIEAVKELSIRLENLEKT